MSLFHQWSCSAMQGGGHDQQQPVVDDRPLETHHVRNIAMRLAVLVERDVDAADRRELEVGRLKGLRLRVVPVIPGIAFRIGAGLVLTEGWRFSNGP